MATGNCAFLTTEDRTRPVGTSGADPSARGHGVPRSASCDAAGRHMKPVLEARSGSQVCKEEWQLPMPAKFTVVSSWLDTVLLWRYRGATWTGEIVRPRRCQCVPRRDGGHTVVTATEPDRSRGHRAAVRRRTVERRSRTEAGDREAPRAHGPAEFGESAHQREPRPRIGPARGGRNRPRADRRRQRRHHDRGPRRGGSGLHLVRPDVGGGPAAPGSARGEAPLGNPAPESPAAAGRRPGLPPRGPWRRHRARPSTELPGGAHSSPGRGRRPLLSDKQGGRTGIHRRGRGDPDAVRVAGGDGDRQRPGLSRRAAGARRLGGSCRHLARGRGGVRREDRRPRPLQSRGAADGCEPGPVGPPASGVAAGDHGPASRRRGGLVRGAAAHAGAGRRGDRARRRDGALGAGRPESCGPWSTPRRSAARTARSFPWWSPCRTWNRWRSWSGSGPNS